MARGVLVAHGHDDGDAFADRRRAFARGKERRRACDRAAQARSQRPSAALTKPSTAQGEATRKQAKKQLDCAPAARAENGREPAAQGRVERDIAQTTQQPPARSVARGRSPARRRRRVAIASKVVIRHSSYAISTGMRVPQTGYPGSKFSDGRARALVCRRKARRNQGGSLARAGAGRNPRAHARLRHQPRHRTAGVRGRRARQRICARCARRCRRAISLSR